MVAVKLQNFGGMIPSIDDNLLPPSSASNAEDVSVSSGTLEGHEQLKLIYTPSSSSIQRVFRIPIALTDAARIPNSYWLEFTTPDVDVIQAPTDADGFERFYWASSNDTPKYNTKARIAAGDPPFLLGIPAPNIAPGVSVSGGTGPTEARAYVYTWVSAYGEESPPSPPTLVTDNSDGTWDLTMTAPGGAATDRNLTHTRIYRTVSGVSGETDYFFVAEVPIATLAYADVIASVTANQIIESLFWTPPPADLKGIVSMGNGIVAGFVRNEVYFCEPYRPHAWPAPYQLTVDSDIIGLGVYGQTLVVCTETSPFTITGATPSAMSVSRLAVIEPCMSRGSIASTPFGVIYASPNGLILVGPAGVQNLTQSMASKSDWSRLLALPTLYGVESNGDYICFGSTAVGCFDPGGFDVGAGFLEQDFTGAFSGASIDPRDPRVAWVKLNSDEPVQSVYADSWTGEIFISRQDGVYWWETDTARPRKVFKWKSKILEVPGATNFEAMRVYFRTLSTSPELTNPRKTTTDIEVDEHMWGVVRVYADERLVVTRELRETGEFFRLPSGFKSTRWQVEIEARVLIESIELAESAKELGDV
jgi:hypothetical protein